MYNANGVGVSKIDRAQIECYTESGFANLPICMANTHLSISHDPNQKGVPASIHCLYTRFGRVRGSFHSLCGEMRTMPGLPSQTAFMHIDLNGDGEIVGLF